MVIKKIRSNKKLLEEFRSKHLGKLNKKSKDLNSALIKILSAVIGFIIFSYAYIILNNIYHFLSLLWSFIILMVLLALFLIILIKAIKSLDKNKVSIREMVLLNLFKSINSLEEYLRIKNPKDIKNSVNYVAKVCDSCLQLPSLEYGAEWERLTNSFFKEIRTYFQEKALKKLKMDSDDNSLNETLSELINIFNALYIEDYKYVSKIKELNKGIEEKKESFLEKHGLSKDLLINLFLSIILMVFSFLVYWGISKIFDSVEFNIGTGVIVSLAVPGALYAGIKLSEKVRRKK